VIIGTPGCSRYFILGVIEVPDPAKLDNALEDVRMKLLADPYLKRIPSMQPEAKKTAIAFHAKDDVPEVRKEVFELLLNFDLKFLAVVRE